MIIFIKIIISPYYKSHVYNIPYTYPRIFSAIKSISSNCGLDINIMLAILGGIVKVPPYNGYIFTTPYSSNKLYFATRPIGPAND